MSENAELEKYIKILKEKGFKLTPQRIEILKLLINNTTHPTAEAIYETVRSKFPMLSLATVYNTLELLTELGLVQRLEFSTRSARYDPNPRMHANLICLECGNIIDYYDVPIKEWMDKVEKETEFKIKRYRVDFYGICKECQAKRKKEIEVTS